MSRKAHPIGFRLGTNMPWVFPQSVLNYSDNLSKQLTLYLWLQNFTQKYSFYFLRYNLFEYSFFDLLVLLFFYPVKLRKKKKTDYLQIGTTIYKVRRRRRRKQNKVFGTVRRYSIMKSRTLLFLKQRLIIICKSKKRKFVKKRFFQLLLRSLYRSFFSKNLKNRWYLQKHFKMSQKTSYYGIQLVKKQRKMKFKLFKKRRLKLFLLIQLKKKKPKILKRFKFRKLLVKRKRLNKKRLDQIKNKSIKQQQLSIQSSFKFNRRKFIRKKKNKIASKNFIKRLSKQAQVKFLRTLKTIYFKKRTKLKLTTRTYLKVFVNKISHLRFKFYLQNELNKLVDKPIYLMLYNFHDIFLTGIFSNQIRIMRLFPRLLLASRVFLFSFNEYKRYNFLGTYSQLILSGCLFRSPHVLVQWVWMFSHKIKKHSLFLTHSQLFNLFSRSLNNLILLIGILNGARVEFNGKLNDSTRTKRKITNFGKTFRRQTLVTNFVYAFKQIPTYIGVLGCKLWLVY